MNKEPKKRISISVPLDMLKRMERINQNERYGDEKVQSIMLCLIDLGFIDVDYYGKLKTALLVMKHVAKEQEQEPVIVPPCGMILEFPKGGGGAVNPSA